MRKIVRNPVKVRIERPNYRKFKVADLGINIIENPKRNNKKPKEYTIMETSIQQNPVYSKSRFANQKRPKEQSIEILVFSQNISNAPYTCFSDGSTDACLPFEWQMTGNILSRMILKSGRKAKDVQEEMSSGSSVIKIPEDDFNQVLKDAEKYGKVFQKERKIKATRATVSEVIECNNSILRYLTVSLKIH